MTGTNFADRKIVEENEKEGTDARGEYFQSLEMLDFNLIYFEFISSSL
jgi:hypothetical protein